MHIFSSDFTVSFNTLIALKDLLKSFKAIFNEAKFLKIINLSILCELL